MSQAAASSGNQTAAPLTPFKGLLVLLAVAVVIGAFIALCLALGVRQFWATFVFLLCWGSVEHINFAKLPACAIGALAGLALAWGEQLLPGWLGDSGKLVFFGLIVVAVYLFIMGWLSVVVNFAFMLFLTVGTIPAVQHGLDYADAFAALGLGIVCFPTLVWAGTRVMAMRAAAQPT